MKSYQDSDPLHGQGKAMPHPKQPTSYTYRGAGGRSVTIDPMLLREERAARKAAHASEKSFVEKGKISLTIHAAVAAILGLTRSFGRSR